jgi:hypothetical protein
MYVWPVILVVFLRKTLLNVTTELPQTQKRLMQNDYY